MNRPVVAAQWLGLTMVVLFMVAFAWLVMSPQSADAQSAEAPRTGSVATLVVSY